MAFNFYHEDKKYPIGEFELCDIKKEEVAERLGISVKDIKI